MKAFWNNLRVREQGALAAGAALVVIYLLYLLVYSPLITAVTQVRQQREEKTQTLAWMQKVSRVHRPAKTPESLTNGQLLSLIARALGRPPYRSFPYQLQQGSSNEVVLVMEKVPYTLILQWLYALARDYTVQIRQLTLDRGATAGVVRLQATLTASQSTPHPAP